LLICAGLVACAARGTDDDDMGMAEVVVHVASAAQYNVTRVTVESENFSQDLSPTTHSGVFGGTLMLPSGTHELVARSFIGGWESGRSSPTAITIQSGRVAQASLSVLEIPLLSMQLWQGDAAPCDVKWFSTHDACSGKPLAPQVASVSVGVLAWGGSSSGPIDIVDSCGGRFEREPDLIADGIGKNGAAWRWLPAFAGGLCQLTGRAISADGVSANLSMAVLVPPGIVPPPPVLEGVIFGNYESEICYVLSARPTDCTFSNFHAGDPMMLVTTLQRWNFLTPSTVEISDTCGSVFTQDPTTGAFFWNQAGTAGATCNIRVKMTAQEGTSTEASTSFQLN
jgi:hypothetical protein